AGNVLDALRRSAALEVGAGESKNVAFKVRATEVGEAKWHWNAKSLSNPDLSDQTESTLEIGYPVPILRATDNLTLKGDQNQQDGLKEIEERLLNGEGTVKVKLSNSLLLE